MEHKVQIEIKDIEQIKWLTETIASYFDQLPKELQEVIIAFSEKGIGDIDVDEFNKRFGKFEKFETNFHSIKITNINEITKNVTYYDDDMRETTEKIDSFWIKLDGKTVIEW